MKNVMITPHVAGRSDCYADMVMPTLLYNLECFVKGKQAEMKNIASPAAS